MRAAGRGNNPFPSALERREHVTKSEEMTMIAGQVTIKDINIQFRVLNGQQRVVEYTAWDGATGMYETVECDAQSFMTALGMALDFDGGEMMVETEEQRKAIEACMPLRLALRFIP
jgi:hypothetical protein